MPVEKKGGALVYAKKPMSEGRETCFALVHDVFGYWTISKGSIEEGENPEEATVREIKEEIGLDIKIEEKLGGNEYVATHPQTGKSLKQGGLFFSQK